MLRVKPTSLTRRQSSQVLAVLVLLMMLSPLALKMPNPSLSLPIRLRPHLYQAVLKKAIKMSMRRNRVVKSIMFQISLLKAQCLRKHLRNLESPFF